MDTTPVACNDCRLSPIHSRIHLLTMQLWEETARLQHEQAQLQREGPWRWLVAVVTFVGGVLLVATFT
ncbi:MAG TPA: hypothetical protein VIO33_06940 [Burkholderiaceae bacterium]